VLCQGGCELRAAEVLCQGALGKKLGQGWVAGVEVLCQGALGPLCQERPSNPTLKLSSVKSRSPLRQKLFSFGKLGSQS
jgi:hypothetical protein